MLATRGGGISHRKKAIMSEQPATPLGVPEWDTADRMRKALRGARITGRQMATYLGVNEATVSTWINGRITPSTQTIRLWALRTGVPYGWLAYGEETTAKESAAPIEITNWRLRAVA
jgi:transcriptional regulator with XRE-family HTH domain